MISKQHSCQLIQTAKGISEKYRIENITASLEKIQKESETFAVRVLFVGSFNAGKSALINALLDKGEYLPEKQSPETAIASELYYATDEKILGKTTNGNLEKIADFSSVSVDRYDCCLHYMNSKGLQELSDYIIVDTPGFDSGIEKHNKALMQYIGKGTAYIVVIDCEKGTISDSTLSFINEMMQYSNDIGILLNKCDKKSQAEVKEIKESMEQLLSFRCGKDFEIIPCSKHDQDIVGKMTNLLRSFVPQALFDKNITGTIQQDIGKLIQALSLIKSKAMLDLSLFDEEIDNREKAKAKILEQITRERKKLNRHLHGDLKESILGNVRAALLNNSDALTDAYKTSVEIFKTKVTEIIRPILITSLDKTTSESYAGFVKNLNFEALCQESHVEDISGIIMNVAEKIQLSIGQTADLKEQESKSGMNNIGNGLNGSFKAITTTLAIATETVAPWLELVIVFLPEIFKILGFISERSQEQQLKTAIDNKAIPQIISRLAQEIDTTLVEIEEMMVQNLEAGITEILEIENQALSEIKKKKEQKQSDFEAYHHGITEDIHCLEELLHSGGTP